MSPFGSPGRHDSTAPDPHRPAGHGRDHAGVGRRDFVRLGVVGGAAAAAGGLSACAPNPRSDSARASAPSSSPADSPAGGSAPGGATPPFELEEVGIVELQRRMAAGAETSASLVRKYLARIDALDRKGPSLHAVIETNPDALAIAEALDAERRSGRTRGPLHGIPVLVKDNVGTADRMTTTAGSLALEGSIPARDSWVAARLREAGAVILGKANLSEWANFRSSKSSSGWSARGGQTRNPFALDRNPSGSSSGSAAAVSANYCPVAVGTETDGSIVSPSNNCGIVGIKPTVGLVSRSGIVPIAHSQDTAGPMARTVEDALILLVAMAGRDPADPITQAAGAHALGERPAILDPKGLEGARIGIPRKGLFGGNAASDRLAEAAIADLKRLGAVIVDPADIATIGKVDKDEYEVLLYEFKADLNAYFAGLGPDARVKSLEEAIRFNEANRERELKYFGQEIFVEAQKKGPLTDTAYLDALARCRRLTRAEGIDETMAKHRLDALVAPTGYPASLTDLVLGDYGYGGCSTFPAVAGYPHVTVPMGDWFGLPVGLSFFGRAWSEAVLIRLAYAFEQATRHRKAPRLPATADLGLA